MDFTTIDSTYGWTGEGVITTNNVEGEGVWYVATESVPSSAFSYRLGRDIRNEWIADQWVDMAEDKFSIELSKFEEHVEKDHMAELKELFEI